MPPCIRAKKDPVTTAFGIFSRPPTPLTRENSAPDPNADTTLHCNNPDKC